MLSHISDSPPSFPHHASLPLPRLSTLPSLIPLRSLRKKTGQHLAEFMRERELVDHENWEEFFLGSIVVVAISGGETLIL